MVTTSYPLTAESSSGVFVARLRKAISAYCSVDVVCPDDRSSCSLQPGVFRSAYALKKWQVLAHEPGGIPAQIRKNRLSLLLVPFLLFFLFWSVFKRARHYSVLHANWAVSGAICAPVSRFLHKPLITTLRGEDVKKTLGFPGNLFLSIAVKYSDVIISVSQDMHKLLALKFPDQIHKCHVINNGVGSEFGNQREAVLENQFDGSFFDFVSVSNLIPRKNIETTIRALSDLKQKGVSFRYRVVGSGECISQLVSLCHELELSDSVLFLGELSPDDVANVLHTSTFFISSSRHEGRPNAVVEAMAAGCCIILSDIGGHRELIEGAGCGMLFDLNSSGSLVDCLSTLMHRKDSVCEMGLSGRQYIVNQNITWKASAKRYLGDYEKLSEN